MIMTPYLRQSLAFEPTSIEIGLLSSQQQNELLLTQVIFIIYQSMDHLLRAHLVPTTM